MLGRVLDWAGGEVWEGVSETVEAVGWVNVQGVVIQETECCVEGYSE
jgi:hypothetical protein